MSDSLEVIEQWIAAYNEQDAAAQAALYAENASSWQYAMPRAVVGHDEIEKSLAAFFIAFPDSHIDTEATFVDGELVAWFWQARGTWRGPFGDMQPNGKPFTLHGSTLFMIENGSIVSQRAYWDRASWFGQLGIPV
jgi:steroid delta-isomerase-like uncharacterized protein